MIEAKQEKTPSKKILVLIQEGNLSKAFYARLMRLQTSGIKYDVKIISDKKPIPENVREVLSAMQDGNYHVVLIDRNVHLPVWGIVDQYEQEVQKREGEQTKENKQGEKSPITKFYIDGTAENILSREMQFTNFVGALRIDKDDKLLFQAAKGEANKSASLSSETKSPNNLDTRFNIASITKRLTAVAAIVMAKKKHRT